MPDNLPSLDLADEIARVCHEANRAYSAMHGDQTHMPWLQSTSEVRQSARSGVMFLAENPMAGPADTHAKWMRHKLDQGWQHGMEKDVPNKLHPDRVRYEQLDPIERAKDRLFCAIVRALLADGTQG